jgi:hypothetical protein
LGNQKIVYSILFASVSQTLLTIGLDPKHLGGQIGFLAILHTWGQNLEYHPHIHCIVAGGALKQDGSWINCSQRFFLPVTVLSRLFRGKFLVAINKAFRNGKLRFAGKLSCLAERKCFGRHLSIAANKEWVVYCKSPFGGPEQVLQYLGRYTHRIAISNHRLISFKESKVTFRWKDYRVGGKQKIMSLTSWEFIRRFLMHIVPSRFVRIRHYGFLANRNRAASLRLIQMNIAHAAQSSAEKAASTESDDRYETCCVCKKGKMRPVAVLAQVNTWDSS